MLLNTFINESDIQINRFVWIQAETTRCYNLNITKHRLYLENLDNKLYLLHLVRQVTQSQSLPLMFKIRHVAIPLEKQMFKEFNGMQ